MNGYFVLKCSTALVLSIGLASCTLPRSGPSHQSIDSSATSKYIAKDKKAGIDYALVDLTKRVTSFFEDDTFASFAKGFGAGRGSAPSVPLGVGDVIEVTIFEAQAGGLFIPEDAGSRPGNYITLPAQTVDRTGLINIPYAGAIRAAGREVADVQDEIQRKLANRAIEPQVVINTTQARSNNISVLGDVNAPAQLSLSPAGERVLDVIARAGGLKAPPDESYVTLERNGRKGTVLFRTLVENPGENIYIRPHDTVVVNRERRTYLVFGATEQAGRIDFEDSNLTLGEALAKSGGLLDGRADPAQVFLYRVVDRKTLTQLGVDVSRFSGDEIPTVFRANLRDPSMFFAMQQFKMRDKDIIYVSNATSVELIKFLSLVNDVSATGANIPSDALTARNSVRRLSN